MLVAALLKTFEIAPPNFVTAAIATSAISTTRSAYSVKSWPSSSFHNRMNKLFIFSSTESELTGGVQNPAYYLASRPPLDASSHLFKASIYSYL